MEDYDNIVSTTCCNCDKIHYTFSGVTICMHKFCKLDVLLDFKTLVEIFNFKQCGSKCSSTICLQVGYSNPMYNIFRPKNPTIFFHKYIYHCSLTNEKGEQLVFSENFYDIINYMDIHYPQFRNVLPQKLARNVDM